MTGETRDRDTYTVRLTGQVERPDGSVACWAAGLRRQGRAVAGNLAVGEAHWYETAPEALERRMPR